MKTSKAMRVVCMRPMNEWQLSSTCKCPDKGDICEVDGVHFGIDDWSFYYLKGYNDIMPDGKRIDFNTYFFRPVDDTFGEWVEETLMKELEYEEALKQ